MIPNIPLSPQEDILQKLEKALSGIDGPCSELLTVADVIWSLCDLNSGAAGSCEYHLMAQVLQERVRVIEGIYSQMYELLEGHKSDDDMSVEKDSDSSQEA